MRNWDSSEIIRCGAARCRFVVKTSFGEMHVITNRDRLDWSVRSQVQDSHGEMITLHGLGRGAMSQLLNLLDAELDAEKSQEFQRT